MLKFEITYSDGTKKQVEVEAAHLAVWLENKLRVKEQVDFDANREKRGQPVGAVIV